LWEKSSGNVAQRFARKKVETVHFAQKPPGRNCERAVKKKKSLSALFT
jgi:hypothetical protein